jgi:hypothetical protein
MTDHDPLRSPHDVDADAERFVDPDDERRPDLPPSAGVETPAEGSIADVIDQRIEVPVDDEP